uniref:Uncharacterized protein n=1 Tax=viral metagenome TaxID=1070528 RepID=A0A6H2A4Z3_9ZZZZ
MELKPERKKEINDRTIEEFYWHGEYPVYVDKKLVNISFERACELAENEPPAEPDCEKVATRRVLINLDK